MFTGDLLVCQHNLLAVCTIHVQLHVAVISTGSDDMNDGANHKIHLDVIGVLVTAKFNESCLNNSKMKNFIGITLKLSCQLSPCS